MATLDLQIQASADDGRKYWTGAAWTWATNSAYQNVGYFQAAIYKIGGGMRFQSVTIPKNSYITSAYFTVRANDSPAGANCKTYIHGEDVDDAAAFSDLANFDGRDRTTAGVPWDNIESFSAENDYNSPDIKTVIQEIVNRSGWASGNALVIFWDDFDDRSTHASENYRSSHSYDGSTTYAPKLHIEYEPPQSVALSPVAAKAQTQDPAVSGSGSAPVALTPVASKSAIQSPTVRGTGTATITLSPVAAKAQIQAPAVSGSGSAPIVLVPVEAVAAIQDPSVSGSGSAPITLSPVTCVSSVKPPEVAGTGTAPITLTPVGAKASVVAPAVSGTGQAIVTLTPVSVAAAVKAPAVSGSGTTTVTLVPVAVVAEVVAPGVSMTVTLTWAEYQALLKGRAVTFRLGWRPGLE
jgi:hypothetical protein